MEEIRTDTGPTVQDWLDAPYTKVLQRNAAKKRDELLLRLIRTCSETSDPKVALVFHEYNKWAALEQVCRTGAVQ